MNDSEKELFHKLMIQRDALQKALGTLVDDLRHGILNHMLGDTCYRKPDHDPEKKCEKGFTRNDIRWQTGFMCVDCPHCVNCHVSLEERRVFEGMKRAQGLLGKPAAEMPPIKPDDFPVYNPTHVEYTVTPRWMARQFYRLAVGYWLFADHKDEQAEKAWERAFDDTISIAMKQIGKDADLFRLCLDFSKRIKTQEEGKAFADEHPTIGKMIEEASDHLDKPIKSEQDIQFLVEHMMILRLEYQFGKPYPGGDLDVYDGVFCQIIDGCLAIVGLQPDGRPNSYDFKDNDEFERKEIEFNVGQKEKLYAFMSEIDGCTVTNIQ